MSEIAIISVRKAKLQQLANEGNTKAKVALELANTPNRFLSTVQIGITLIGIFAGALGGATIAEELKIFIYSILIYIPVLHTAMSAPGCQLWLSAQPTSLP